VSYYGLNCFLYDLRMPEARAAYQADPARVLAGSDLTDGERALVEALDWNGLADAGANPYLIPNLGKAANVSFPEIGARMRGETGDEWAASLRRQNERVAAFALHPEEALHG
jgi:hypothetical protein